MQAALAQAVLQAFQDPPPLQLHGVLAGFSARTWRRNLRWLDNNGIALYFLDRLKHLQWERVLPVDILERLEARLADNRARTLDLLDEFERINRAFLADGVVFVNVKGIALEPDSCPKLELRHQIDLDFTVQDRDIERCSNLLHALGYGLSRADEKTWEFKAGAEGIPSIKDMYKVKPQREVEIHLVPSDSPLLLGRAWVSRGELRVPVLAAIDAFCNQAEHLFKHLHEEWVRLNWLLEFRNHIVSKTGDETFWRQVRVNAAEDHWLSTAIGAGIALVSDSIGPFTVEQLSGWTDQEMDSHVQLWLQRYGRQVALADMPGTKLYLLLPKKGMNPVEATEDRWRRLLPLHRPVSKVRTQTHAGTLARWRRWRAQLQYTKVRLRFHLAEGWRYWMEAPHWQKALDRLQQ